jgi:hypothetical protein
VQFAWHERRAARNVAEHASRQCCSNDIRAERHLEATPIDDSDIPSLHKTSHARAIDRERLARLASQSGVMTIP